VFFNIVNGSGLSFHLTNLLIPVGFLLIILSFYLSQDKRENQGFVDSATQTAQNPEAQL
jgi:hypothetical protein